MQAHSANLSSIKLNFGGERAGNSPVDARFNLQFFSHEYASLKSSFQSQTKNKIDQTALVLQLTVQSANADQLAKRLNETKPIIKTNQNPTRSLIFYGQNNTLLCVLQGQHMQQQIGQLTSMFDSLKQDANKQPQEIRLRITSNNDLQKIEHQFKENGMFYGFLNSLHVDFTFVKTALVVDFLKIIFENILNMPQIMNAINSFRRVNLEVNCASSSLLNQFPTILFQPDKPQKKYKIVQILIEANIQHAKVFLLNPTIVGKGDIQVEGLSKMLAHNFCL